MSFSHESYTQVVWQKNIEYTKVALDYIYCAPLILQHQNEWEIARRQLHN